MATPNVTTELKVRLPEDSNSNLKYLRHLQGQIVGYVRTDYCTTLAQHVTQVQHDERLYTLQSRWLDVRTVAKLPPESDPEIVSDTDAG